MKFTVFAGGALALAMMMTLNAAGQVHKWSHGVLTNGNPVPAPKRVLDPTSWKFAFQDYTVAGE